MHTITQNVSIAAIPIDGTNYTVTAGTGALTATEIDMDGFDSCAIFWLLGTVTDGAVITPSVKNSNTSGSYGSGTIDNIWTPAAQTYATGANASNRFIRVDISKPQRRFIRAILTRATANSQVLSMIVVRYRAQAAPVVQGTTAGNVIFEAVLNAPTPSLV